MSKSEGVPQIDCWKIAVHPNTVGAFRLMLSLGNGPSSKLTKDDAHWMSFECWSLVAGNFLKPSSFEVSLDKSISFSKGDQYARQM